MHKISIHIVTWNSASVIEQCLFSLQGNNTNNATIVIVDNASTDDTIGLIRNSGIKATVIRNATNVGFARAHNQALRLTQSEYVLVANADVILSESYLKECVSVMDKHQRIGSVQGKLLRMPLHDLADMPQEIVKQAKVLDSTGIIRRRSWECYDRGSGEKDHGQYDADEKIFGTSGALSLYKRAALDSIAYNSTEYFDELFHSYKEDVDVAIRLNKFGWLSAYVPTARAVHIRSAAAVSNNSLARRKKTRSLRSPHERYYSYRNHLYILFKHVKPIDLLFQGPWIVVYELKKLLYALISEQKLLTAWVDIFRVLAKLTYKRNKRI